MQGPDRMPSTARLQSVSDFEDLVAYLSDELGWPVDADNFDQLVFQYEPDEIGLTEESAPGLKRVLQMRPLVASQPWGVFFVDFEDARLPVSVLRRVLRHFVERRRPTALSSTTRTWDVEDLLFISCQGTAANRGIAFAHFHQSERGVPELRTFSWDEAETHFYYLANVNLACLRWPDQPADAVAWRDGWRQAFPVRHGQVLRDARSLSLALAEMAARTRDAAMQLYTSESKAGPLHQMHARFRTILDHQMTPSGMADVLAQVAAYGLFSARASGELADDLASLDTLLSRSNPLLKGLFLELAGNGAGGLDLVADELGVRDLVLLLNHTDMGAIVRDFGRTSREGAEDPVVHFYEDFLREYDKDQKVQRGVFYTPKPVVRFMVEAVDACLRSRGHEDGLADDTSTLVDGQRQFAVTILDPAVGTGTFIEAIIDRVHTTMWQKWTDVPEPERQTLWNAYVSESLLPRLFGFELMVAPYAVAHLKVGLKLKETGFEFGDHDRLHIYLTNSLEDNAAGTERLFAPNDALSLEAAAADIVKSQTAVSVVLGNPPYSNFSANLGEAERALVQRYKEIDGIRLHERNALQFERNVNDDYLKFFARAEDVLSRSEVAVFCMIANSSALDARTLRGVRARQIRIYESTDIVDLGGSGNFSGSSNSEILDQNVFDITQPVAIYLSSRSALATNAPGHARYFRLPGSRRQKYDFLAATPLCEVEFEPLSPRSDNFLLVPHQSDSAWDEMLELPEMLPLYAEGLKTGLDEALVAFSAAELEVSVRSLLSDPEDVVRSRFGIGDKGWGSTLMAKRGAMGAGYRGEESARRFCYRPLDYRFTPWPSSLLKSGSMVAGRHMIDPTHLCLVLAGQVVGPATVSHFLVCRSVPDNRLMYSRKGSASYFPVWSTTGACFIPSAVREFFADALGAVWTDSPQASDRDEVGAADIIHYCYAVFHSTEYRRRFDSELRRGFPRVPMPDSREHFWVLSRLGSELVSIHLGEPDYAGLESVTESRDLIGEVQSRPAEMLAKPYPDYRDGVLRLSPALSIAGVAARTWNLEIGGYRCCEKWLKARRGLRLNREFLAELSEVLSSADRTNQVVDLIDRAVSS